MDREFIEIARAATADGWNGVAAYWAGARAGENYERDESPAAAHYAAAEAYWIGRDARRAYGGDECQDNGLTFAEGWFHGRQRSAWGR